MTGQGNTRAVMVIYKNTEQVDIVGILLGFYNCYKRWWKLVGELWYNIVCSRPSYPIREHDISDMAELKLQPIYYYKKWNYSFGSADN